jgi:multidrug efflux pump subunit AcrA (membrane-fusion protein)
VLSETVNLLFKVCEKQQKQRQEAAREAKARAEALRKEKEAAERARKAEEEARQAALEQQRAEAERQRQADEQAEQDRLLKEREVAAAKQVESIALGGWIVLAPEGEGEEPARLKLAVKISASRKFVFVDRLGLNRREFLHDDLVSGIVSGRIRVLGSAAEFDDTLSRVVGRIRVGRN